MNGEFFKAEEKLDGYSYPSSFKEFVNGQDLSFLDPWLIGASEEVFDRSGKVYFYISETSLLDVDWDSQFSLPDFNSWLEKVRSGEV